MKTKPLLRWSRFYLLFLLLIVFSLCWAHNAWASKDYSIQSVTIEAQLNSDGSMDIKEKRVYNFHGHFHWATYFLPTGKTGGVVEFSISEEDRIYQRSSGTIRGTYQYQETSNLVSAKWFFDAKDETRTFIISYRILDVVKLYADAAILYYKFVGTGWDKPSKVVRVYIFPPQSIGKENVRAWVHGPLWGNIEIMDDGKVVANVNRLSARTFWEVRAIYPTSLFSQIKNTIPQEAIPRILAEEKKWADEANSKRKEWLKKKEIKKTRKRYGALVVLVLSGIGFLIWISLYNRYGKKHKVSFPDTLYSEIPSDIPPALLSHLLYRGQISGGALMSTLLDLAQRGFLKIKEETKIKKIIFGSYKDRQYSLELDRAFYSENKGDLQDFEENLLDFLFNYLSEGKDVINFKTLKKKRSKFTKWFIKWKKKVKRFGESKGHWEKDSLKAKNKVIITSVILFVITGILAVFIEEWAFVLGVVAVALLTLSYFIPRRTPQFELEAKKWMALKKYLTKYHFRESHNQFLIENISKFLVYGIVLGIPKKVVKQMAEMIPEGEQSRYVPWYAYSGKHADFSPLGFAEGLSSLMSTATSTMSSAAGTGGGASGGGGGGAGGSGGGAG